jgi:hypothetical protein
MTTSPAVTAEVGSDATSENSRLDAKTAPPGAKIVTRYRCCQPFFYFVDDVAAK